MNTKHLNPWFGVVPIHWQNGQLKRFYSVRLGKMLQPNPANPQDELVHYVRAANITWAGPDISDIKMMWASSSEIDNNQLEAGDLLVSEGGDVGRSCLWSVEIPRCIFQNAINRIRPRNENSTKFLRYVMEAVKGSGWIDTICNKATIAHFTAEKTNELDIPIPTPFHQRRIATYLDEQTAKIDHLMALRRRQMELLKEQRAAAIQQAVTRGLNPNAPMKDSGSPLFSEIPITWLSVKLKYLGKVVSGFAFDSKDFTDSGIRVIKIANIQTMRLDWEDESFLPETYLQKYSNFIVSTGDLVFALTRPVISTGLKAAIADINKEQVLLNQRNAVLKPNNKVKCEFLYYAVFSQYFVTDFVSRIDETGQQPNISPIEISNIPIALPPLSVQEEIVESIRCEEVRINNLIASYARQLTILAEYRAALIHECVTGQRQVPDIDPSLTPAHLRLRSGQVSLRAKETNEEGVAHAL